MISNLFIFLSAVFCLIAFAMIISNYKSNEYINEYLITLFLGAFLHRVYYSLSSFGILDFKLEYNLNLAYFLVPLYFLMFMKLHNRRIKKNSIILLMVLSGIPLAAKIFDLIKPLENFIYFAIFTSLLMFITIKTAFDSLKKSEYKFKSLHFKFSSFLLFHIILIFLGTNILIFYKINQVSVVFELFYKISSLSWLILVVFMLLNPELLFGKKKLENILAGEYWDGLEIWSLKPLIKIQYKDARLSQTISDISKIIIKINNEVKDEPNFIHNLTIYKLHESINIPKSHFNYIFKYHCHLSKVEFNNYQQINYVINKIKKGYLKTYTMESLIENSGFKSKMTFYRSFKKYTNTTPSEFFKKYSESQSIKDI